MVFMPNFQNFLYFAPSFGTYGSFTILSFLIVSIFTFSFLEVMLFMYFLVTLSKTVILCLFSAKMFLKNSVTCAK